MYEFSLNTTNKNREPAAMKAAFLMPLLLTACSTVTMMDGGEISVPDGACNVRVFQTQSQALKQGPIEELCIITGDTSFRISHHSSAAIEKHKSKACACGATNVYVQSRHDGDLGAQGQVTMVAFRFTNQTGAGGTNRSSNPAPSSEGNKPSTLAAKDPDAAKVVQLLVADGFPIVGEPRQFKQEGNRSFYEVWGERGRVVHVVCESGVCRTRTNRD